MSSLALRRRLSRPGRHPRLLAVVAVGLAIAAHHGGAQAMGDHHAMDMGAAIEMCVGAFVAVGAAVLAVAIGLLALGRWKPIVSAWPVTCGASMRAPTARARAGPSLLRMLCISRT